MTKNNLGVVHKVVGGCRGKPIDQCLSVPIFLRNLDVAKRPFNRQIRVIPPNRCLRSSIVSACTLVLYLDVFAERAKATGEASWSPYLTRVIFGNFKTDPLPQRGRALPDVHCN